MGQIYLVRHGQASLGADNYDQLSALGQRQSRRLGEYWRSLGVQLDAVMSGTLQRHAQTLQGIEHGLQSALHATLWPGLNEYDAEAVIRSVHPEPHPRPTSPDTYRAHFRLLREGLRQWMRGSAQPEGMPSWTDFVEGVRGALDQVQQQHDGAVLIVSSGGPIATAIAQVLQLSPEMAIELNLRMRNTSVSELDFHRRRISCVSFNALPHLADPAYADWITYA